MFQPLVFFFSSLSYFLSLLSLDFSLPSLFFLSLQFNIKATLFALLNSFPSYTMPVQRTVKVITTQEILKDEPKVQAFHTRKWSIEIVLVGPNGQDLPATVFDKVTYKLHPTFQDPVRTFKEPPFRIEEKGWGEFDLTIVLHFQDRAGEQTILHDLHFRSNRYEVLHTVNFPTNKPGLLKLLQESGPVPPIKSAGHSKTTSSVDSPSSTPTGDHKRKIEGGAGLNPKTKKKSKTFEKGSVDLEKLADSLQKLGEDDLLGVVQMVTDNKTSEMYIKNDVEEGEFHMDLYTLPDSLLKSLWEYVKKRVEV